MRCDGRNPNPERQRCTIRVGSVARYNGLQITDAHGAHSTHNGGEAGAEWMRPAFAVVSSTWSGGSSRLNAGRSRFNVPSSDQPWAPRGNTRGAWHWQSAELSGPQFLCKPLTWSASKPWHRRPSVDDTYQAKRRGSTGTLREKRGFCSGSALLPEGLAGQTRGWVGPDVCVFRRPNEAA